MKTLLLLFILLLPFTTQAQNTYGYNHEVKDLNIVSEQQAINWLNNFTKTEQKVDIEWRVDYVIESPIGLHYKFSQYWGNYPIYRSAAKINTFKTGKVLNIAYSYFDLSSTEIETEEIKSFDKVMTKYSNENSFKKIENPEQQEAPFFAWLYNDENNQLSLTQKIWLEEENTGKAYEILIDRNGNEVSFIELQKYFSNEDTTAQAMVFLPDPLTSAGQEYVAPFDDQDDQDVPELNGERSLVQIDVTYEEGLFFLENPYVKIDDNISAPNVAPPPTNNDGNFQFTRSQSGFEDVNVLYHITEFQKYVQELGFTNLFNGQITADPHGANEQDNSFFRYSSKSLIFGEGGVDDAEDADVIIHEYAHALSNEASPGSNLTAITEREALDEAYGDYFAASYSRRFSDYRWGDVFTWDGHNEYWSGRRVDTDKHYPEDINNEIYSDSELFSSALMDVYNELGAETTDILVLNSLYFNINTTNFPAAAMNILSVDQTIFNSQNQEILITIFCLRGFLPCPVSAGKDQNICLGETASIGEDSSIPLEEFQINWEGVNIIEGEESWAPTVFPENDAQYIISATDLATGEISNDTVAITVELCDLADSPEQIELINTNNFASGLQNPILIFPIETEKTDVTIFNQQGQLMSSFSYDGSDPLVLEGKHFPAGFYVVEIVSDGEEQKFTMVKGR